MASPLFKFRHTVLLFVVSAILLLSGLDKIDINIMEARNFISAREMVENDQYLLPTLNNEPRYQKPPLPIWMTALAGRLFGFDSLFGLRLPVVAVTLLLVLVIYHFSKLLGLSSKHSMNNALILITSFYIFFSGRDNQWDMYTHSFMMTSIYFTVRLLKEDLFFIRNSLFAALFFGFSVLSKGPVSFYALYLPFILSFAWIYRPIFRRKGRYLLLIVLGGLLIGFSWYMYVRFKDPESFQKMALRETSNWVGYELKPFYYYWSFFLQSGLWGIASFIALMYPYLKSRVSNLKAYQFSLLWTILSLLLLSLVPEKKIRYLVSVLIPLALTTGFYIEYLFHHFNEYMNKREKKVVYAAFGVFAIISFTAPFALLYFLKDQLLQHLFVLVLNFVWMFIVTYFIIKGLVEGSFGKTFYSMIALFTIVVITLIPLYKQVVYNPAYASTQKVRMLEKQYGIISYNLNYLAPEILWDYGKAIPTIEKSDNVFHPPKEKIFGLMTERKDSTALGKQFSGYKIEKVYRINLNYNKKLKDRLIKDYYVLSKGPV